MTGMSCGISSTPLVTIFIWNAGIASATSSAAVSRIDKPGRRITRPVTATPVVSTNSPWFNELHVRLANSGSLTALSITVVVQRTPGVSYSGQYNSVGGQIAQTNSSTASIITYQFTLGAGQTLGASTGRTFAVQTSGNGTLHPTTGDTYSVTYTTAGQTSTTTGHF